MATTTVRRFAISLDPDEPMDFAMSSDEIGKVLSGLGLETVGSYVWRHSDQECLIKIEITRSSDGYYINALVQAADEHPYRLKEIGDAFSGYVIDGTKRA